MQLQILMPININSELSRLRVPLCFKVLWVFFGFGLRLQGFMFNITRKAACPRPCWKFVQEDIRFRVSGCRGWALGAYEIHYNREKTRDGHVHLKFILGEGIISVKPSHC